MKIIFEEPEPCPCIMKTDMEAEDDVYEFIEYYYPEINDENKWYQLPPEYLKCTHCIFSTALNLVENNIQKYGKEKAFKLAQSLCILTSEYNYIKKAIEEAEKQL